MEVRIRTFRACFAQLTLFFRSCVPWSNSPVWCVQNSPRYVVDFLITCFAPFATFSLFTHSSISSPDTMARESLSLSSEETRGLEEDRIILGGPQNGKRKVSAALLSPPFGYGSQSSAGRRRSTSRTTSPPPRLYRP